MSTISNGITTVTPILIEGYTAERATRNITHQILGSNERAVSLRPAEFRTGSIKALFETQAAAILLEQLLAAAQLLTYADSVLPATNMTFISGNFKTEIDDSTLAVWWVEFDFVEVIP